MHEKISSEKSILTGAVINIVLTGNVFIDQNGGYHTLDEKVLQEERDEYASLQYNHLIDTSRRVQSFF